MVGYDGNIRGIEFDNIYIHIYLYIYIYVYTYIHIYTYIYISPALNGLLYCVKPKIGVRIPHYWINPILPVFPGLIVGYA
jgi:hypothetical protein